MLSDNSAVKTRLTLTLSQTEDPDVMSEPTADPDDGMLQSIANDDVCLWSTIGGAPQRRGVVGQSRGVCAERTWRRTKAVRPWISTFHSFSALRHQGRSLVPFPLHQIFPRALAQEERRYGGWLVCETQQPALPGTKPGRSDVLDFLFLVVPAFFCDIACGMQ